MNEGSKGHMSRHKHLITLFTRLNCSICDKAKQALINVSNNPPPGHILEVEHVDIDLPGNKQVHDKYNYNVPIGFMNGQEVFRYWVNEEKIAQILQQQSNNDKT